MCGIAGSHRGDISQVLSKQKHRGRDPGGYVELTDEQISFGHNRLAVIDLTDTGRQPMDNDRYLLTYNGEIYNYKDFNYKGNDAHTLLELISHHGLKSSLKWINGMFAFGLYDRLENKISLVVDRFGQKPLYYYKDETGFYFASCPSALLHLKEKWKINQSALVSYWALGSVIEDSIWEGIKKVPGGHEATYDCGNKSISVSRWYYPAYQENTSDLDELIIDAIRKVKVSDVPVHIFLSGGVDSTLVASEFQGGNAVHLRSVETGYAQQVAKKFNLELNIVDPAPADLMACLIDYSSKCGEPTMAGAIPYIVAGETAKLCKVAVTANGADELFFGYNRTNDKITQAQYNHIFREQFGYLYQPDKEIDDRLPQGRWMELQTYVQHDLNKTLDFASMAHTLEVRAPFLDHRLVEMALSVPQRDHGRKQILKSLLRRHGFKEDFIERAKQGFSLSVPMEEFDIAKKEALIWCMNRGFLNMKNNISGRDLLYLQSAAAGFYCWYQIFKDKL